MADELGVAAAIAIDGTVASGKTTVGRLVAERLGYAFLDTGLMYRAATWQAIRAGVDVGDDDSLTRMVEAMRIELTRDSDGRRADQSWNGVDATDELRTPEVDHNVSAVSAVSGVRRALVSKQREVAVAESGRVVMVGQDIGSKVLPDAGVKIYLEASVEVRARRRYDEMVASGASGKSEADFKTVLAAVRRRDRLDSTRADSPRSVAHGAAVIETDELSASEVADRALEERRKRR